METTLSLWMGDLRDRHLLVKVSRSKSKRTLVYDVRHNTSNNDIICLTDLPATFSGGYETRAWVSFYSNEGVVMSSGSILQLGKYCSEDSHWWLLRSYWESWSRFQYFISNSSFNRGKLFARIDSQANSHENWRYIEPILGWVLS